MFSETSLSEKKEIYGNLKMEDITDADYKHTKRILEDFGTKHLGQYDDLYNTLLLEDVFENFQTSVSSYTNLILLAFSQHQDYHGKHV